MKQKICKLILKLFGWSTSLTVEVPDKCIFCVAPHTSNYDFIVGKIGYCAVGGARPSFLIKKEWFRFPFNLFFGPIGGIAVDRGKRQSLSEQIVEEFGKRDKFQLAITPEGTRKKNPEWKKGFYYIAKKAGVPILLTHLDYEKKELGINKIFYPTDNEAEDIRQIKRYFKDVKGRHPEQFSIGSAAND